jgi:hypothetical protein
MRKIWEATLLLGAFFSFIAGPRYVSAQAPPQACSDEQSMVEGSKQDLLAFAGTVKEESVTKFETLNHQKGALSKLSLHDSMLGELMDCLDKASQDTTASKDDVAAAKTQHDAAAKLQAKIKQQEHAIKDAKTSQDAKAVIGSLDLAP